MRVQCRHCEKGFTIPDEKVPENDVLRFKCPVCGGKNEVDTHKDEAGESLDKPGAASQEEPEEMLEPEVFPPGAEVAFLFVHDGEWAEGAREYLTQMGMYLSTADTVSQARQKLKLNRYNWVIVEDRRDNGPVLQEVGSWPGYRRREVNVILVGQSAKSFDPSRAFAMGANCYLCIDDTDRIEEHLEQAREEYNQYIAPWQVAMEQVEV